MFGAAFWRHPLKGDVNFKFVTRGSVAVNLVNR